MDNSTVKFFRTVLWLQALYYSITAIWPIVDVESFVEVSGPKTDVWLVKTVAVLLIAISINFFVNLYTRSYSTSVVALALSSAIGLASIDIYYVSINRISRVYLADAALEIILIIAWLIIIFLIKKNK